MAPLERRTKDSLFVFLFSLFSQNILPARFKKGKSQKPCFS
jgi:hypothetical protein